MNGKTVHTVQRFHLLIKKNKLHRNDVKIPVKNNRTFRQQLKDVKSTAMVLR